MLLHVRCYCVMGKGSRDFCHEHFLQCMVIVNMHDVVYGLVHMLDTWRFICDLL